jgi:hypothetical protein
VKTVDFQAHEAAFARDAQPFLMFALDRGARVLWMRTLWAPDRDAAVAAARADSSPAARVELWSAPVCVLREDRVSRER